MMVHCLATLIAVRTRVAELTRRGSAAWTPPVCPEDLVGLLERSPVVVTGDYPGSQPPKSDTQDDARDLERL